MRYEPVMQLIGRLGGTVKFFPSDPDARIGIAEEIAAMARDEEQVRWLVARLPKLFREWPGMLEVRAVFCSKFRPKDGIETYSAAYIDGVPSEREETPALLAGASLRALPAPEGISAAESLRDFVHAAAVAKNMNRAVKGIAPPKIPDIPTVRITGSNRITAADVEKAARELREKRAKDATQVTA